MESYMVRNEISNIYDFKSSDEGLMYLNECITKKFPDFTLKESYNNGSYNGFRVIYMRGNILINLGGTSGNIYPNIAGELKIVSENPYCASCTGVIQQFHEMFPNIKLILVDGAK